MENVLTTLKNINDEKSRKLINHLSSIYPDEFEVLNISLDYSEMGLKRMSSQLDNQYIDKARIRIINKKLLSIEHNEDLTPEQTYDLVSFLKINNINNNVIQIPHKFSDWILLNDLSNLVRVKLKSPNEDVKFDELKPLPLLTSLVLDTESSKVLNLLKSSLLNIKTLHYTSDNLSSDFINHFENLESLNIIEQSEKILSNLRLNRLSRLTCSQDVDLNELSGCPNLENISGRIDTSIIQTTGPELSVIKVFGNELNSFDAKNIKTNKLKELQIFFIDDVKIEKEIPSLETYFLHRNRHSSENIKELSFSLSTLGLLKNLKILSFSGLIIDDTSDMWKHSSLTTLASPNAKLDNINFVPKLVNLSHLFIPNNNVDSLEPLIGMKNLVLVNVNNNNIVDIPRKLSESFSFFTKEMDIDREEKNIILSENPLISPPIEIIERSAESAKSYFESMLGDTEELNEAKIIFLGNGEVGKTSLMKVLSGENFNAEEETTHGINIKKYTVPINDKCSVDASIWDFGGQQIMHATHQLFLSRRCVYVLVINDRRDDLEQEQKINYWLQQVQTFGGNSKVIIIRNKSDMFLSNNIPEGKLKEKYPNLIAIESVSCKTGKNIQRVRNLIEAQVRQLPMRKVRLARNWIQIKDEIKDLSLEHDHLPLSSFTDICNRYGVTNFEAQKTLRNLLHDLSVIIAFEELDGFNMGILNPHWITDGIYTIINSEVLSKKKGYIKLSEVQDELDKKHPDKYTFKAKFIIESMIQFELCHPVGSLSNNTYLVPNLLPNEIKSKFIKRGKNTIKFVFKYDNLLPPSIIPSLLVRMSSQISDDKRWRTGAIMADPDLGVQAIVEEDSVERELKIEVTGAQVRAYFSIIRHNIRNLNAPNAETLGVRELVPLTNSSNEYVDYDELIGLEVMGKTTYTSGKLKQEFSVSQLLSGIESREETESSVAKQSGDIKLSVKIDQAPITIRTGDVTNTNTLSSEQSQVTTQSVDIKVELNGLIGTGAYVLEDLKSEAEHEILNEVDRNRFVRECDKVQNAISSLGDVETPEDAKNKAGAFLRVKDFLSNALEKKGSVGEAVEALGSQITKIRELAKKSNKIAGFFGFPTVPDVLVD